MARDIRGDGTWQQRPVIGSPGDNQNWRNRVPNATKGQKESIGIRTSTGISDEKGKIIDPNTGRPLGIRTSLIHNLSEIESDWEAKMILEPCCLCDHWRPDTITLDEKIQFLRNLVREHGWTEEAVAKEIGDPREYGFCEVDELLTHKAASCPQNWTPKKTVAKTFMRLGLGRRNRK